MSVIKVHPLPETFVGIPLRRWLYAARIWVATVVALAIAFWLQLDGASTAAVSVSILAVQTRGQTFQKAGYRVAATGLGVVASIAITGLFAQTPDLYIIAVALWLGAGVFVAGMFDGNRAYGAVLSGYTVCIVAVLQLDAPQSVFLSGLNRGAAIAVAIVALALVNSLTGASSVYGGLEQKFVAVRAAVTAFVQATLDQGENGYATAAADLMKSVTGLHPEMTALYFESAQGQYRGRAVRRVAAALVLEIEAAYALTLFLSGDRVWHQEIAHVLQDGDRRRIAAIRERLAENTSDAPDVVAASLVHLLDADVEVSEAISDFQLGRSSRSARLRLYRSKRAAAWYASRVALTAAAMGFLAAATNWPATSTIYAFVGVIAALGASTPDVRSFSKIALVGAPVAAVIVGVIEFLILDGVNQFELLALSLAPATIGAALLQSSPKVPRAVFGFMLLVFVPMILSPSNPQTYNPESYLLTSLFTIISAALTYLSLIVFPPLSDARRLRWIMADVREDARRALQASTSIASEERAFRDADRISQIGALCGDRVGRGATLLEEAFLLAAISRAASAAHIVLARLPAFGAAARTGLATLDASGLRDAARLALIGAGHEPGTFRANRDASAALFWVAALAETHAFKDIVDFQHGP
jgi:uncharacterized membrane protein YccC